MQATQAQTAIYRQVFGNSTNVSSANVALSTVGWQGNWGPTATDSSNPSPNNFGLSASVGSPTTLDNINAGGPASTTINGYMFTSGTGANLNNWIAYQNTYTVNTAVTPIQTISFYCASAANGAYGIPGARIAVQIGGNWYVTSQVFSNTVSVSSGSNVNSLAQQVTFTWTTAASAWDSLTFVPGASLVLGSALTSPLPGGNLTAFGLYSDQEPGGGNATRRFDTFEIDTGVAAGPPIAGFYGSPTNGPAALPVTFTDTSSGIITNWSWTFGDGGITNLTTAGVAHTYNTPGTYSVTEIVTGPGGSSTNTASNYITVLATPVANFTATPTNGTAPLAVTFTDTSGGTITNWSWTFGDGGITNLTTAGVAHTYNTPGTYSVTEIVTGPGGSSTNTASNYITVQVTQAPTPIYRQVFGNSTNVSSANVALSTVGWQGNWGPTATDSSNPSPNNFGISDSVGTPTTLDNINAGGPAIHHNQWLPVHQRDRGDR